jgi:hypothetical protein
MSAQVEMSEVVEEHLNEDIVAQCNEDVNASEELDTTVCCRGSTRCLTLWAGIILFHIGLIYMVTYTTNQLLQYFLILFLLIGYEIAFGYVISKIKKSWYYSIVWIVFVFMIMAIGSRVAAIIEFIFFTPLTNFNDYTTSYRLLSLFLASIPSFCVAIYVFTYKKIDAMIFNIYLGVIDILWTIVRLSDGDISLLVKCVCFISVVVIVICLLANIRRLLTLPVCGWLLWSATFVYFFTAPPAFNFLGDHDYQKYLYFLSSLIVFFVGVVFPSLSTSLCGFFEMSIFGSWFVSTFFSGGVFRFVFLACIGLCLILYAVLAPDATNVSGTVFKIRYSLHQLLSPAPPPELPIQSNDNTNLHQFHTDFVELELLNMNTVRRYSNA